MPPEEKELLKKNLELAEENNRLLKSLHRSMRIRRLVSIAYWVLIIGSAVGLWYFLEPFLEQIIGTYDGAKSNFEELGDFLQNIPKKP